VIMASTSIFTTWTLILAAAIVAVLAVYLIAVAVQLHRASRHLTALAAGLVRVKNNAAPLEEKLTTIAGALSALDTQFKEVDDHLAATTKALGD